MVAVDPQQRRRRDRARGDRERGVAADAIISAVRGTVADLWVQPDKLGDHIGGAGAILADDAAVAVIDIAVRRAAARHRDAIIHAVIDVGLAGIAGARVGGQAAIAVIAGGDAYPGRAGFTRRVAARVVADAARARRGGDVRQTVGASGAGVGVARRRIGIGGERAIGDAGAVAALVMRIVGAAQRPARRVYAREAAIAVIGIGDATV